jgi:hypothetical protein
MRAIAENNFHGVDKLNCAQAILKTYKSHYPHVSDSMISDNSKSGGGRVEGNMCGAIYGATLLELNSEVQEKLTDGFIKVAGSLKCKVIRKAKTISCKECVGVTADLLTAHLQDGSTNL